MTKKECERECNCNIEIEESLVVIVCGEIDINRLKNYFQAYEEVKGKKNPVDQE